MTYNPDHHQRRSIRLEGYDYSQAGAYYVTIICKDGVAFFEDPALGAFVEETWLWLREQYQHVDLDEYVVMPNHVHGVVLLDGVLQGGSRAAPTFPVPRKALGSIIGAFKTVSTKRINELLGTPGTAV